MNLIVAYVDDRRVVFDADKINNIVCQTGDNVEIETEIYGEEYTLFEDNKSAGEEAKEYWKDMAENDPDEFVELIGKDTLVEWALGRSAGPGNVAVNSLEEWLDLTAEYPEEHFATYDGTERDFVCRHPDFSHFTVAYRTN